MPAVPPRLRNKLRLLKSVNAEIRTFRVVLQKAAFTGGLSAVTLLLLTYAAPFYSSRHYAINILYDKFLYGKRFIDWDACF